MTISIFSNNEKDLKDYFEKNALPSFRKDQIFNWIYEKRVSSFDEMKNIPKGLISKLKQDFSFFTVNLMQKFVSKTKETIKYLFQLSDGNFIESVLIISKERKTLCISSQVGCRAGCKFCASGKEGFTRNLDTSEIIQQVFLVEKDLNEKVNNIVFMGMGEPFHNYDNVIKAITILISENGFNISQRKITISTVGIIDKIKKLQNEKFKVNLTLSLHGPNQAIREKIMPSAYKNRFKDLIKAMDDYFSATKRDITLEYILIDALNDKLKHAKELSKVITNPHFKINLIPYNKVDGLSYNRSENKAIVAFKHELEKNGVKVTQRYAKGDDIDAACGQLAFRKRG